MKALSALVTICIIVSLSIPALPSVNAEEPINITIKPETPMSGGTVEWQASLVA